MSVFGLKTKLSSPHTVTWKSKVYQITSKHYLNSVSMLSLLSITSDNVWNHSFFQWSLELTHLIILKFGQNYLQIRLLLITPFTKAKLERMFSWFNCVKTDYCNRLGQERLEHLLLIGEEEPEFDADVFMGFWYDGKVWQMKTAKPQYPKKQKSNQISLEIMDIATYTLSDLGEEEEEGDLSNDN